MTSPDLCDSLRWDLMRVADGEADADVQRRVDEHLKTCPRCREEYDELLKLKGVTRSMRLQDLPDARWAGYWQDLYRRLERGTGWFLLSVGLILVCCWAVLELFQNFFFDTQVPLVVRLGFGTAAVGVIILLVSILRERLFARKIERYDKVEL